jgi:hypothetical protein
MYRTALLLTAALLAAPCALLAQSSSISFVSPDATSDSTSALAFEGAGQAASPIRGARNGGAVSDGMFSRLAFGAGISPLGIQLQAATNITRHFNVRGTGSFFGYTDSFTTNGISASAKLNLASAGASLDVYPFHSGFRLSPGVLFYNQNGLSASTNVAPGTSFTLNESTYYSASANPVTGATPVVGTATLGLYANKPAFSITTGWGNMVKSTGHWSFPFEAGVAFTGQPTLTASLSGWACLDQAQTQCQNIADPNNPIAQAVQNNLSAQIAKWTSDISPLRFYPILSFGVGYSFRIR